MRGAPWRRQGRSGGRRPLVVALALVALIAGALGVAGYLRLRRFLGGALEGYPEPRDSGVVETGSVSTNVVLDYDRGTAAKTFSHPPPVVRWLYRLSFQAPFPYTANVDAFEAARQLRLVAGLLTKHWFGRNLVAPVLEVRRDEDGRFTLVSELVPGGAPRNQARARDTLRALTERFLEAGLPAWQVGDYNPRAIGNLIERDDGSYQVIDLESNFVTLFLPRAALARALRRGQYPSFDDIDVPRLRAYLSAQREELLRTLGEEDVRRLWEAVDAYAGAAARWHSREPRMVGRVLRLAFWCVDPLAWQERLPALRERARSLAWR